MTGAKWLDGYKGQKVIIIEDLDKYTCHGLAHYLKLWGDRYPVTAEVKGSTIPLMHHILYVTSNYTIAELYAPDQERHTNQQRDRSEAIIKAIEDRFLTVKRFICHPAMPVRKPATSVQAIEKQPMKKPEEEQISESSDE